MLGINADGTAQIRDNLMTAPASCPARRPRPHLLRRIAQRLHHLRAADEPLRGDRAGIVRPGRARRAAQQSDCSARWATASSWLPGSGVATAPVDVAITGNEIRDNSDGITLITDQGATANFMVDDNIVEDISQILPDPACGSTDHVVRSRGITTITIDHSVSTLALTNFVGSNLSPAGSFASDGIVILASGVEPLTTNHIADVVIANPNMTGDSDGDWMDAAHGAGRRVERRHYASEAERPGQYKHQDHRSRQPRLRRLQRLGQRLGADECRRRGLGGLPDPLQRERADAGARWERRRPRRSGCS